MTRSYISSAHTLSQNDGKIQLVDSEQRESLTHLIRNWSNLDSYFTRQTISQCDQHSPLTERLAASCSNAVVPTLFLLCYKRKRPGSDQAHLSFTQAGGASPAAVHSASVAVRFLGSSFALLKKE